MVVLILDFGALVVALIPMSIAIGSIVVTVAISPVLGQFPKAQALAHGEDLLHKVGLHGKTAAYPSSAVFDDPNLVSSAGLVPVLALADAVGFRALADEHLSLPSDKGANAGLKVASLVAGMVAGADSIDDMGLLRHGGMGRMSRTPMRPGRWARSCARSPSATSDNSTRSPPGS